MNDLANLVKYYTELLSKEINCVDDHEELDMAFEQEHHYLGEYEITSVNLDDAVALAEIFRKAGWHSEDLEFNIAKASATPTISKALAFDIIEFNENRVKLEQMESMWAAA